MEGIQQSFNPCFIGSYSSTELWWKKEGIIVFQSFLA
jgi:hypothetical protein